MKRTKLALTLVLIILISAAAVILLIDFADDTEAAVKLYTYPVSVGEKNYTISVRSNYVSAPKVYLSESSNTVEVDFMGSQRATVSCNITIPADLIWGELIVYHKYYKMNEADYTLSDNSTHNSIQTTFDHIATIDHFEIRATEGVISGLPSSSPIPSSTTALSSTRYYMNI